MISYNRLWETMRRQNISQYRMIHYYNISSSQLNRLRNNKHVSTHTLENLCRILDCGVEGVAEVVFDAQVEEK